MNLRDSLNKAIHYLDEKIREKLDSGTYPTGNDEYRPNYVSIQDSAIVTEAQDVAEGYRAIVSYGGRDAPYALAYEYGSGEQGGGDTYPIYPVDASALYFYWDRISADVLVPKRGGGATYYIPSSKLLIIGKGKVDHPGIEAKPYVAPTIQEEKDNIAEMIGTDFTIAVRNVIDEAIGNEVFRIEVGF